MPAAVRAQQEPPGPGQPPATPPSPAQPEAPPPSPESPDLIRQSREHFDRGVRLYAARQYREAIRQFELSAARVRGSSPDLWYNIARCYEQLGEYLAAVEHYERYLRDRADPPDAAAVQSQIQSLRARHEAERLARQQRPESATLRVSTPRGSSVTIDGRDSTRAVASDSGLVLGAGTYRLRVEREGHVPFVARVPLLARQSFTAQSTLPHATRYRTTRSSRLWTWIVGGLSVASLGTAVYFGVDASSELSDGARETARDRAAISDAFLGGAVGLGVAAVFLWFAEGASGETEQVSGTPAPSPPAAAPR